MSSRVLRPDEDYLSGLSRLPPHVGVESITQTDDTHLHWVAKIAGVTREWDAEGLIRSPPSLGLDGREGMQNAGVVTVHRLSDDTTRIMLQLDVEPEGLVEQVGDKLGILKRRAAGDLERFKHFIEGRGAETGAWRGEVPSEPRRDVRCSPGALPVRRVPSRSTTFPVRRQG
jgi:uncharacterized membrane protein